MPIKILSVETLDESVSEPLVYKHDTYISKIWREEVDSGNCEIEATYGNGAPALVKNHHVYYLGSVTDDAFLIAVLKDLIDLQGIKSVNLGHELRLSQRGRYLFAFNYSNEKKHVEISKTSKLILGTHPVAPRDFSVWNLEAS